MAAAWLAASCRISSSDAAWATARLSWVSFLSRATAGSSARKAPLGRSVLLDMDPSAADRHVVGLLVMCAAPGLVYADATPEPIAPLDLEQDEVVAHITQPGEIGGTGRCLQGSMDHVFQDEEGGDPQDGHPLHQRIEKVVNSLGVCGRHGQIPDGVDDDP